MNKTPQITIRMPVSNNISCLLEKANGQRFLFSIKGAMQSLQNDETSTRILTREGKVIAEKANINSA